MREVAQAQPWELREDISGLLLSEDWAERVDGALSRSRARIATGEPVPVEDSRYSALMRQAYYLLLIKEAPEESAEWYHQQVVSAGFDVSERTLRRDLQKHGATLRVMRRRYS